MKILKLNPKKTKAQAMVEFAIALPVLLLIVYGLIETGRYLFVSISVNNAARQAVRYGSTSGIGPNGVERYRDCNGIRDAAENSDFLNAFNAYSAAYFVIEYDHGPGTSVFANCTGSTSNVSPVTGDRVHVRINAEFHALLPRFLPFLSRTLASNPLVAESSRTLLLTIEIQSLEPTTTAVTILPPESKPGEWVTVTVKVTADNGVTKPTGTVTITGQDEGCSSPLTIDANGTASCTIRFNSLGPKLVYGVYSGDTDHESSSGSADHSVRTNPIITVSTSPNPSQVSDTITVTVSVTSNGYGSPADGSTVTITGSDGVGCTITLSGGTGTCVSPNKFTSEGVKSVTATFAGNTEFTPGSNTIIHDVLAPQETRVRFLSDSPDPSELNQQVTVNIAVIALTTPTGTVTLTGADTINCPAFNGGLLTCAVRFASLGNKTLSASYSGDASHLASSATESHTVALAATKTTITLITPEPSLSGDPVTVSVSVTGGLTTPTGTVTITGGDTPCTITLPATSCSTTFTVATSGSKTVTATYNGDSLHAPSSGTASHTVSQPAVANCNNTTVTLSLLQLSGGNLTVGINNTLPAQLQIKDITFTWYENKGHTSGQEKKLFLQTVQLGSTTIWSDNVIHPEWGGVIPGDNSGLVTINNPASAFLPANTTTTLTFIYQQAQDRWDDDSVTINLATPGCEGVILFQNQH